MLSQDLAECHQSQAEGSDFDGVPCLGVLGQCRL